MVSPPAAAALRPEVLARWYAAVARDPARGLIDRNLVTGETEWDANALALFGLAPGAAPPRREALFDRLHADDAPALAAAFAQALLGPDRGHFHCRADCGVRGWRSFDVDWVSGRNAAGQAVVTAALHDVTEARAREQGIETERAQLLLAADAAQIGLTRERIGDGRIRLNPAALRIFGVAGDAGPELPAEPLLQRIHPADRPAVQAARRFALDPGAIPAEIGYRVMHPDGRIRHVLARRRVLRAADGRPRELIGALVDITDRALAQERERHLRESQSMALALAQMGVWEQWPADGEIDLDERMRQIIGWEGLSRRMSPRQFMALLHPDDRAAVNAEVAALRGGQAERRTLDLRLQRPDGSTCWIRMLAAPIKGADGQVLGLHGTAIDISDEVRRRTAEQRALQADLALQQSAALAAERAGLLAAVSHEVRSPLNAILVSAEQLRCRPLAADPQAASWLSTLEDAGQHLYALAEDLLRGAAADAGLDEGGHETVELGTKVAQVYQWLDKTAHDAGVALLADPSLAGARVRMSPLRMRQVLLNVVGNAIKYNRRGGRVRCSLLPGARPGQAALVVEDSGAGMSQEQRSRLFRPFDRLGREGGAIGGFGLGLYLTRRLVLAAGGEIEVESALGVGSRVTLRLPVCAGAQPADAAAPAAATGAAGPAAAAPCGQVLAVDDDPVAAVLLEAQFDAVGGPVLRAVSSVEQALAAIEQAPPDLLLLDMNLGALRGDAVLHRLRAAGFSGPAVAYTGEAGAAARQAMLASGFVDVWVKPVGTEQISAGLRRWLPPDAPRAAGTEFRPPARAGSAAAPD